MKICENIHNKDYTKVERMSRTLRELRRTSHFCFSMGLLFHSEVSWRYSSMTFWRLVAISVYNAEADATKKVGSLCCWQGWGYTKDFGSGCFDTVKAPSVSRGTVQNWWETVWTRFLKNRKDNKYKTLKLMSAMDEMTRHKKPCRCVSPIRFGPKRDPETISFCGTVDAETLFGRAQESITSTFILPSPLRTAKTQIYSGNFFIHCLKWRHPLDKVIWLIFTFTVRHHLSVSLEIKTICWYWRNVAGKFDGHGIQTMERYWTS